MEIVCKQWDNENVVDSWYLDFLFIFGLLKLKGCVSFLFWKKKWQRFELQYCAKVLFITVIPRLYIFPNF